MTFYDQASNGGVETPGHDCLHCGNPGFKHDKIKRFHGDGTWSYDYRCPNE